MSGWFETLSSETVWQGLFKVRADLVSMPEGEPSTRYVVEHPGAVAVVPLMDDGTVILLRQYRHPISGYAIEIPAGRLDVPGESPADAAQRELIEEIGHRAGRLDKLLEFHNSVGWTDEVTHVYVGRQLEGAPRPDDFVAKGEEQDMEVLRLPLDACHEMIADGSITDAKTILGLLRAPRV